MSGYPTARAVSRVALRDRILVDGQDVTFFRDVEIQVPPYELTEPFAYGPLDLPVPQVDATLEALGTGDLSWIRHGAPVEIQRVDDDGAVQVTDYRGVVTGINVDGRNLTLEVGGDLSGRAELRNKPNPVARRVHDVGFWFAQVIETLRLGIDDRDGPLVGIETVERGGGTWLQWAQQVCADSQDDTGTQRTMMPKVWGGNVWGFAEKDYTTKHLTLFTDDARVVLNLRDDIAERPNTFTGTGVSQEGVHWNNAKYPGVIAGPAPTFPGNMSLGDVDADTATGDGVTVLNTKLIAMHYLAITQSFAYGTYSAATAAAVKALQHDAHLSVTGTVNSATWDALFDVSATGSSLSMAGIRPIVQADEVRIYDETANGSVAGLNDEFDPTVLEVGRHIDFGPGVSKAQGIAYARGQFARVQTMKNWTGTITLNGLSGFVGEWSPGDAPTGDDIMGLRDIRPGMNAWLPLFDGGTLVHIAGVRVDPQAQTATLTVDTQARDLLEVSAIMERNSEARRNLRREWLTSNRPQRPSGNMVERNELFGELGEDVPLEGGKWNVFTVPIGQSGTVNAVDIRLRNSKAEFAVAVLSRRITAKRLQRTIGNPLTTAKESVWETNAKAAEWLRDKTILYAAGDGTQPCGYFPRRHRDDDGDVTNAPITGDHYDAGSPWSYAALASQPCLVQVAIYPDRDCKVKAGTLFYAQEDDVV